MAECSPTQLQPWQGDDHRGTLRRKAAAPASALYDIVTDTAATALSPRPPHLRVRQARHRPFNFNTSGQLSGPNAARLPGI